MRSSRGEILIEQILMDNNLNFEEEYSFPELRADNGRLLRFDFVVFDDDDNIDFIIEYQGRQHYEPVGAYGGKAGFYKQKHNDDKKRRFCALNHYNLIEIPYTDENLITYDYIMSKAGY